MAPLSNFYIDTILGIESNTQNIPNYDLPQDLRKVRNYEEFQDRKILAPSSNTSTCSSPRSSSAEESYSSGSGSDDNEEFSSSTFENFYVKTLALHQIKLAQLQLRPPAWSQKQQFRNSNSNSVEKKSRKYTEDQIAILVTRYQASKYVPREDMAKLSAQTGLSMLQVKIWFQNRRLKDRKAQRNN